MTTTAAARHAHSAPLGTGELHRALEDARDLANLHAFCNALACTASDVSADGLRLDVLRALDLMRGRGYSISNPTRPQLQQRKGSTTWLVNVILPAGGPSFVLGFYTPNTS